MKYLITVLMLALWVGLPLVVQAQRVRPVQMHPQERGADPDTSYPIDITPLLYQLPEAQQAAAEFHRLKAEGLLPGKRTSTDALGDTMTFKVLNSETFQLNNIDFVLRAESERVQIWVELDEEDVSEDDIEAMMQALTVQTPTGSFNSNAGIVANNETVFGDSPNFDGDNKVDVLWHDIRDGYTEGGSWNPGFFWPG